MQEWFLDLQTVRECCVAHTHWIAILMKRVDFSLIPKVVKEMCNFVSCMNSHSVWSSSWYTCVLQILPRPIFASVSGYTQFPPPKKDSFRYQNVRGGELHAKLSTIPMNFFQDPSGTLIRIEIKHIKILTAWGRLIFFKNFLGLNAPPYHFRKRKKAGDA